MSIAVVFSGQGNQHPAMLPWLHDDGLLADMSARLRVPDWRAALADPAWARMNAHAQPLITATALAAWSRIEPLLRAASIEVDGLAGYSVGELAACSAAGVFAADEAIRLAALRAALMDEAALARPGGLCGVTGLAAVDIESVLRNTPVSIAIRNGEDSVVIGGPLGAEGLDAAEAALAARGARCTRLAVSIASHTSLMRAASEAFGASLLDVEAQTPVLPLFDSDGNRSWNADRVRAGLWRQIAATVRWDEVMDQLAARGPSCALEIGGGQALARLWQQRHAAIPARSADEFRTLDGVLAWIERCAA